MNRSAVPPGPKLPMLGTLVMPGRDPLAIFTAFARDYGDVVYFRMGGERVFFVNHPDYIRQVFVTDHAKFAKRRALERARKLLGDGLLTSDGPANQRKRRLVQPARWRGPGFSSVNRLRLPPGRARRCAVCSEQRRRPLTPSRRFPSSHAS